MLKNLVLICFSLYFCLPSYAEERIHSFISKIIVLENSVIDVTETITITSERIKIHHGIYRDFQIERLNNHKEILPVDINIISIKRDGNNEKFHFTSYLNSMRLFIGDSNIYLLPGKTYTYTLHYQLNNQLNAYDSKDELYFNITGNGWEFPIDSVNATVLLPTDVSSDSIQYTAYTGYDGDQVQNHFKSKNRLSTIIFSSTKSLLNQQGMSIAVSWNKGVINFSDVDTNYWNYQSNSMFSIIDRTLNKFSALYGSSFTILFSGLIIFLLYYFIVWFRYGKDPVISDAFPQDDIINELSPAKLRYLVTNEYDHKTFMVAIVNLAIKGWISIIEEKQNTDSQESNYTLKKLPQENLGKTSRDEKLIYLKLFSDKNETEIKLNAKNTLTMRKAIQAHNDKIEKECDEKYFIKNTKWQKIGFVLAFLPASISIFNSIGFVLGMITNVMLIMIIGLNFLFGGTIVKFYNYYKRGLLNSEAKFILPILTFYGFMNGLFLFFLYTVVSFSLVELVLVFCFGTIQGIFYYIMASPTASSLPTFKNIIGLRMFLKNIEKYKSRSFEDFNTAKNQFDIYLPYAMALDFDTQWGDRFNSLHTDEHFNQNHINSYWYIGSDWNNVVSNNFCSEFSTNFESSILTAAYSGQSGSSVSGGYSGSGYSRGGGYSGGSGGNYGGGGW